MHSWRCCGLGLSQKLWRERFGLTPAARGTLWPVLRRMRCAMTWMGEQLSPPIILLHDLQLAPPALVGGAEDVCTATAMKAEDVNV
jgi:hypothetical protein